MTVAVLVAIAAVWIIAYFRVPLLVTTILVGGALVAATYFGWLLPAALIALWVVYLLLALGLNLPPLRRALIGNRVYNLFRRLMPPMSATEREALAAGTVWWEAEFFTGRPRWKRLLGIARPALSPEEQAFLDGPVEELCRMINDWEIAHERHDLPPEVWTFARRAAIAVDDFAPACL
ncbi:MAG: hypothetical protein ACJ8J7_12350 [Sulfurifustaceae bacterium]